MSHKQDLITNIRVARSAMQLPPLKLGRKTTEELQKIWRETYQEAKRAGLIRG